jgi:helix-turn-helix protein
MSSSYGFIIFLLAVIQSTQLSRVQSSQAEEVSSFSPDHTLPFLSLIFCFIVSSDNTTIIVNNINDSEDNNYNNNNKNNSIVQLLWLERDS